MKRKRPVVQPGPMPQTTMRIPQALIERADALVPKMNDIPVQRARGTVSRSDVLRLAMARGMAALERMVGRR